MKPAHGVTPEFYNHTFRPRWQPAQALYDAFQQEALMRDSRTVDQWTAYEVEAVWKAAMYQAKMLDLRVPTIDEIKEAEQAARGHVDYGSKWAYYVERSMRQPAAEA